MASAEERVREQVIRDIWLALGRDPQSTEQDEVVWPDQEDMWLPVPFYFEDERLSLTDAATYSVDVINAQYLDGSEEVSGVRAMTAFDFMDDYYYVIEHGGPEQYLRVVTPKLNDRNAFAAIERYWIRRNIVPSSLPFPTKLDAIDMDSTWFRRELTHALFQRGVDGYQHVWDIIERDRRIEAVDPDAVLAFWRQSVEPGKKDDPMVSTGQIPGLTDPEPYSEEFDAWLEHAAPLWSDTEEPIAPSTARALRIICFYLATPQAFFE